MPRRQRVHLDDAPLRIVQRGHNREPCFFGDEDCFTYLHWFGEAWTETGGQLAYALMTNHVHLLVTPHSAGRAAADLRFNLFDPPYTSNSSQTYLKY
jgi:REP-associated tyrosine transposase